MLTRGVEKAISLTFLYPEFAAKSFDTHEAYVDHVLARQQEIHDLVRRNTHQAQQIFDANCNTIALFKHELTSR